MKGLLIKNQYPPLSLANQNPILKLTPQQLIAKAKLQSLNKFLFFSLINLLVHLFYVIVLKIVLVSRVEETLAMDKIYRFPLDTSIFTSILLEESLAID